MDVDVEEEEEEFGKPADFEVFGRRREARSGERRATGKIGGKDFFCLAGVGTTAHTLASNPKVTVMCGNDVRLRPLVSKLR